MALECRKSCNKWFRQQFPLDFFLLHIFFCSPLSVFPFTSLQRARRALANRRYFSVDLEIRSHFNGACFLSLHAIFVDTLALTAIGWFNGDGWVRIKHKSQEHSSIATSSQPSFTSFLSLIRLTECYL